MINYLPDTAAIVREANSDNAQPPAVSPAPAAKIIDMGFFLDPSAIPTAYTTNEHPMVAFRSLLEEHGFRPGPEIQANWSIERIPDAQDKGLKKSGWYLYSEMVESSTGQVIGIGVFGSWRGSPEKVVWCSKKTTAMDAAEQRMYSERIEQARAMREAEMVSRYAKAAEEVKELWQAAIPATQGHAYCTRKGIQPRDGEARVVPSSAENYAGWLMVPVQSELIPPDLVSAQYISPDKNTQLGKFFHTGGRIKGCFTVLPGNSDLPRDTTDTIYVCEGFATGQTIRDATGCTTLVAFNAGNLTDVAAYARGIFPRCRLAIAADNDHEQPKGNTGKNAAEQAAAVTRATVLMPPPNKGDTDFNDYCKLYGRAATAKLLEMPPLPEPVAAQDIYSSTALEGLIRTTLDWIKVNSFYHQEELGLLNIIAALGAVCGRRYRLEDYGTRTNIYTLGIAPTGMGKDNSRKCIKTLLRASGLQEYIGSDEIRSGPGLLDHVVQKPAMLYQVDEFGMFLKAMANANAPGYAQTIPAILTKLYSSSGSSYETGNLKGEDGLPPSIMEPCLSLYGTTTESTYAEAMKASSIASGELNRYVVGKAKVNFPDINENVSNIPPTDMLLRHWVSFKPIAGKEPTIVRLGTMRDSLMELRRYQRTMQMDLFNEGLDGIFARYFENTVKIAMILAIARNNVEPVLEEDTLGFAANMVQNSLEFVLYFARDKMFETELHRQCNKTLELVGNSKDGEMSRRDVMRMLHFSAKEMNDIEATLGVETGSGKMVFNPKARPVMYRVIR